MKKLNLTDQLKMRMVTLLDRHEREFATVRDDIESYMSGYKDVSKMKFTLKQIDFIMKEIK